MNLLRQQPQPERIGSDSSARTERVFNEERLPRLQGIPALKRRL